jgi:hypothetical protein
MFLIISLQLKLRYGHSKISLFYKNSYDKIGNDHVPENMSYC